jgi:hypothetical protein
MITKGDLEELFTCDPVAGILFHGENARRDVVGKPAGWRQWSGHIKIRVKGKTYCRSHLIWLWVTGEWPSPEIDHIDTNASNDAFSNLRVATRAQNCANKNVRSDNVSGLKGVSKDGNRWRAYLGKGGKMTIIGWFLTKEEASVAYRAAASEAYGEFARW